MTFHSLKVHDSGFHSLKFDDSGFWVFWVPVFIYKLAMWFFKNGNMIRHSSLLGIWTIILHNYNFRSSIMIDISPNRFQWALSSTIWSLTDAFTMCVKVSKPFFCRWLIKINSYSLLKLVTFDLFRFSRCICEFNKFSIWNTNELAGW